MLKSRFQKKTEPNTDVSRDFNEETIYEVCREFREPPMGDEAPRNPQYQEVVTTYSSFLKVKEEETVSPELRDQEEEQPHRSYSPRGMQPLPETMNRA